MVEIKPISLISGSKAVEVKKQAAIEFCKNCGLEYILTDIKILSEQEIKEMYDNETIRFTDKYKKLYQERLKGTK